MSLHDIDNPYRKLFGLCPICRKTDGLVNFGDMQYFVCHEHRKRWHIASVWDSRNIVDWLESAVSTYEDVEWASEPTGASPAAAASLQDAHVREWERTEG